MKQATLFRRSALPNPADVVFTPEPLAKMVVETFNPRGKCLEPCKGNGAFLKYLPADSDWCEITEGRDFFDATGGIVTIIGISSSRVAGFPFGYPLGIFHFKRDYTGLTNIRIDLK